MDVIFFNSKNLQNITCFEQVNENSILGGGRFTASHIDDLFELLHIDVVKHKKCIWEISQPVAQMFVSISDEALMQFGSDWADCDSWKGLSVNSMDLVGHILEVKHNYLSQPKQENMWILFE